MKEKTEGVRKIWDRYKYAILVALIGAGLLLWPVGSLWGPGGGTDAPETERHGGQDSQEDQEDREDREKIQTIQEEMEAILSTMSGVGQVRVMLTVDTDGERQLAQDTQLSYSGDTASPEDYSRRSETVLVDGGDAAVVVRRVCPTYRGALVVCEGGDRAEVRLAVTEAVAALTGLSTDRVTVAKWQ